MVSVIVGAVVAAGSENAVQQGFSGNDKIQLVPVTGSGGDARTLSGRV